MDERDVIRELEQELNDMGVHAPDSSATASDAASVAGSASSPATASAAAPETVVDISTDNLKVVGPTAPIAPEVSSVPAPVAEIPVPAESAPVPASVAEAPVSVPPMVPPAPEPVLETEAAPIPPVAEAVVPPTPPAPAEVTREEHHEVMGQVLTQAIQKGKNEVPHQPDPMVSKPLDLQSWRVFKIMSEFVEGFELLRKYTRAVSFFGSARRSFATRYYDEATALSSKLAQAGFAVITGGSAGIMEAANKGAFEVGGASIGLNIRLDDNQGLNEYLTDSLTFEHFFVRKVMLTFASEVYIYFPGGFGTLDEFSEIVTLVQTKKIRKIPIVLYGREYWESYTKLFEEKLLKEYGAIDASDLELYHVVDSVDEAYEYIMKSVG